MAYKVYRATRNLYPCYDTIDPSQSAVFSCTVDGVCTAYKITIYNNDDNSQVYTHTNIFSGASNYVYNQHKLEISIPAGTMISGGTYKWVLSLSADQGSSYIDSYEILFYAFNTPTLTIKSFDSGITSNNLSVSAIYEQADGLNLDWYQWILYDEFDNVIEKSEQIVDVNPKYVFNGLASQHSYSVQVIGESEHGISIQSDKIPFTVSYDYAESLVNLDTQINYDRDSITVTWPILHRINGTNSGSIDYINYNIIDGYKPAVYIPTGSSIEWNSNLNVNENFTKILNIKIYGDGDISQIKMDSNSNKRNLYYYLGHLYCTGDNVNLETGHVIMHNRAYKIAERPDSLYVKRFGMHINGGDSTNDGTPKRYFNGGTSANSGDPRICIDGGVKRAILLNKNSGIIATNAITNGNFDTSSNNLAAGFVLYKATAIACTGNKQTVIATGQYGGIASSASPIAGHRYFVCSVVTAAATTVVLQVKTSASVNKIAAHPGGGATVRLSMIADVSTVQDGAFVVQDNATSGWSNFSVQSFMAVDMGTADVPMPYYNFSADKMADLFSTYIDGTVNGESSNFENLTLLGSGVSASNFESIETLNGGGVNEFNANL